MWLSVRSVVLSGRSMHGSRKHVSSLREDSYQSPKLHLLSHSHGQVIV